MRGSSRPRNMMLASRYTSRRVGEGRFALDATPCLMVLLQLASRC
jgi:hypothetical protein